jgi:TPR repeat protein
VPPILPAQEPRQLDREEITAAPPTPPAQAPRQLDREEITAVPPILPAQAPRQLDREEIAVLLKRGKDLIANGDLAAARLVLQRAADVNDVEATLALAATYDPFVLRELRVYSFPADAEMARVWYEKARELGSSAASRRLEMLSGGAR